MRIAFGFDKLHIHAYLIGSALHASFEDICDTELRRDRWQIIRRTFETLR